MNSKPADAVPGSFRVCMNGAISIHTSMSMISISDKAIYLCFVLVILGFTVLDVVIISIRKYFEFP